MGRGGRHRISKTGGSTQSGGRSIRRCPSSSCNLRGGGGRRGVPLPIRSATVGDKRPSRQTQLLGVWRSTLAIRAQETEAGVGAILFKKPASDENRVAHLWAVHACAVHQF